MSLQRREFVKTVPAALGSVGGTSALSAFGQGAGGDGRFPLSLAQWSMHRALKSGELDPLDWARHTRETFGIEALEYVNQFFCVGDRHEDRYGYQPKDRDYLAKMKKRAADHGMTNVLVMCDGVGRLGDPDGKRRSDAVEGHFAWLEAARFLGCHSIRVNAASDPKLFPEEQARLCADGLARLSAKAATLNLNVIVENHGGLSSDGSWLATVMKLVDRDNCGTLPDFGNFYVVKNRGNQDAYEKQKGLYPGRDLRENEQGLFYDRYRGIADLMPFAKGVSAKAHDFDADGNEIHTDFRRALKIVADSGYSGYVGIEYEGKTPSEVEGIRKTKALLERVLADL